MLVLVEKLVHTLGSDTGDSHRPCMRNDNSHFAMLGAVWAMPEHLLPMPSPLGRPCRHFKSRAHVCNVDLVSLFDMQPSRGDLVPSCGQYHGGTGRNPQEELARMRHAHHERKQSVGVL